jgi:hypothetical protein
MRPSQFKFTKTIPRVLKLSSQISFSNMHQKIKIPLYQFQATTFHQSNVSIFVLLGPEGQASKPGNHPSEWCSFSPLQQSVS